MSELPTVSVVLPVRNEAAFIRQCLASIQAQNYPNVTEIIVADGFSEDDTRRIVSAINDDRIQLIDNPNQTAASGMNAGLARAKGDIIVRVDGHAILSSDYVSQCVNTLRNTQAYNVGGPMRPEGVTSTGKAIAAATGSPFAVPTQFHHSDKPQYVDTVYLGAWPRWVLEKAGGYNENVSVNEDYELNVRIRKMGGRIFLSPDIRSSYYGRQTLQALARQYFRYGAAKVLTIIEHPISTRPRHLVAPAFVGALTAGALFAPLHKLGRWLFGLVAGSYALANLAASAWTARKHSRSTLLLLPPVFATIHVAWGVGFWVGIWRKLTGKN